MKLEKRQRIAQAFDRAASSYDSVAQMQQRYAMDLIKHLESYCHPTVMCDLACGTGYNFKSLRRTFPQAQLVGLDIAPAMLAIAATRMGKTHALIQADLTRLPLRHTSCDLLLCHFALQWCDNLNNALCTFKHVLKTGACLSIATFGERTLQELAVVTQQVNGQSMVNQFVAQEALVALLTQQNFEIVYHRVVIETLYMTEVKQLMNYLKSLGANTVLQSQLRGLGGKQRLEAYQVAYQVFADERAKLPATFEINLINAIAK